LSICAHTENVNHYNTTDAVDCRTIGTYPTLRLSNHKMCDARPVTKFPSQFRSITALSLLPNYTAWNGGACAKGFNRLCRGQEKNSGPADHKSALEPLCQCFRPGFCRI